jgi:hypothetical protein
MKFPSLFRRLFARVATSEAPMFSVQKRLPLIVLLIVASLLGANRLRRAHREALPLDDWDVPQLIDHLRRQGLELRVVSTQNSGTLRHNAYLTTTAKKREELELLPKAPERAERWQGTLYVERSHNADVFVQYWGDCCLVVGPFIFFGDRELLARVRDTLVP